MKYIQALLVIGLFLTLTVGSAVAQTREGFEIGLGPSILVASGDGESDTGFGAHLTLAYGIGERFTIGLNGAAGAIKDDTDDDGEIVASVGGIFGRLYFGAPTNRSRPYFLFGGGQGSMEADFMGSTIDVSGPSGMLGVGLDHVRPGSRFGFFGEVNYNFVNFEEVTIDGISFDGFDVDVDYIVFAAGIRVRIQ